VIPDQAIHSSTGDDNTGEKMFIPLRIHSVYSKGRGGGTLDELSSWVSRKKLPHAALTDIGNLYGWGRWKRAARGHGFSPVFGCEVKLRDHVFVFLIKDQAGYGNLMAILNRREMGCTEDLVTIWIPGVRKGESEETPVPLPHEDFYVGCDLFNFKRAHEYAGKTRAPMVWAQPLKFVRSPDRLLLLHAVHKKIPFPPERDRFGPRISVFGPDQEIHARRKFGSAVDSPLKKTFEVAEKCRFSFSDVVPSLPGDLFPVGLREVVTKRLRELKSLSWEERQRARRELEVVERSGFSPYFLVVHDVVRFARRHGILHNLKGSGASSYLAYLLGISRVDPMKFDLYFERFLNRGRDDPPDFDLDFDSRMRDQVLAYVLDKYGRGRTGAAFVCSLKNYRARSALYETARAFGLPPGESRELSKRAPYFAAPDYLKTENPPAGYLDIWRMASDLTSVYRESSLHVGGVILTPAGVDRYLPLETSAKGYVMSHFDRDAVEDLKLIKLDLLSVRGLAAISETKKRMNIKNIPLGDEQTYRLMQEGRTIGCFQVESPAMINLIRRMKPRDIREMTQALALIRPGPTESGMKRALLRSREGLSVPRDPVMVRILPETGGLLLYEEQVMQVADRVAGMSAEDGDLLRRGLKRKEPSPLKPIFFRAAAERGYTTAEVTRLWNVMKKFSAYSFNKAHSASYAHMAYQAVYLKAHHPVPYLTAVLNAGGGYYNIPEYVEEAKRRGIKILAPDINRSAYVFTVEGVNIRVGFMSIKGLARKTAEKLIEERGLGEYASITDALTRVSLSKSELFSLIKAGVFDSLEPRRSQQILRFFQGLEDVAEVSDLDARQKEGMLVEALGFDPEGDSLSLFNGRRPELRIKDLPSRLGREVELVVRVVDARLKGARGKSRYFFLFEDETGLVEGVGAMKSLMFGAPPACWVRGEIRRDGGGRTKMFNCSFISPRMRPS